MRVRSVFILVILIERSLQIYDPSSLPIKKPIKYTSEIVYHQNYSKVYHHGGRDSKTQDPETSTQRLFPVYNAHSYGVRPNNSRNEKLSQVYVLNGSKIEDNENPNRKINSYNKQKRTPKVQIYQSCPPEATGSFVYEFSCNQFLNCWKGRGYVQNCAPGTLFNPRTLECDWPEKVQCVTGPRESVLATERSSRNVQQADCPKEFSGLIPNYTDCSKFINCVNGVKNLVECPPGTLFDVNKNICDFAKTATCFKIQVKRHIDDKLGFMGCQSNQCSRNDRKQNLQYPLAVKCSNGAVGLQKHPTDCSKFLQCDHGITHVQSCGPGTLFNPVIKVCDWPQNVHCDGGGIPCQGNCGQQTGASYNYNQGGAGSGLNRNIIDYGQTVTSYGGSSGSYEQNTRVNLNIPNRLPSNRETYDNSGEPCRGTCNSPTGQGGTGQQTQYNHYGGSSGYYGQTTGVKINIPTRQPFSTNTFTTSYGNIPVDCQGNCDRQSGGQQFSFNNRPRPSQGSNIYNPYGQNNRDTGSYGGPCQGNFPCNSNQGGEESSSSQTPYQQPYGREPLPCQNNCNEQPTNQGSTIYPYQPRPQSSSGFGLGIQPTRVPISQNTPCQSNCRQGQTSNNQWYQQHPTMTSTTNYDGVVNINHVRPHSTTQKPVYVVTPSRPMDYDDISDFDHGRKQVRSTPSTPLDKGWPPAFPSTDINADYVYEPEHEVTLEAENVIQSDICTKNDFYCTLDNCIPKISVCNGVRDCQNGNDEVGCIGHLSKFSVGKNRKLAILEKERWNNVSVATCAFLCLNAHKVHCRAFNYRKIDRACFLTNSNEALTGAVIAYSPFDYYELVTEKIDCRDMFVCSNKKCISNEQICDGHDDCGDRMDEKGCKAENFGYKIALKGSKNHNEGRIEVSAFGQTGFVCDDKFGLRDAHVVCKEMGYPLGALEVKGNSYFARDVLDKKPFYMMDDISCLGNETRLMDCDFSGWGVHNCREEEIAGVVCKTQEEKCQQDYWSCDTGQECLPLAFLCDGLLDCTDRSDEGSQHCDAPVVIRLSNGTSSKEGRLEIRRHGTWGTVCDDDFNEDAAKVVCRQLGFKGSAAVRKNGFFGAGKGPIWLDQVYCAGNETGIEDCSHWNWGEHNCEHTEDVGVSCGEAREIHVKQEERHATNFRRLVPTYPSKCGYRKNNIFTVDDNIHARVVKGSVALPGEYPWQAAIRVKGKKKAAHWCGAVIISEKFVLTAAHCLVGYAKGSYVIIAGDYNVDEDEGTEQEAYIEDFYLHKNFRDGHKMNNDIALVKLKGRGFRLNEDVQAICLPEEDAGYEDNLNCTISGFGSVESGKSAFSHTLRAGWVPIQKREICTMPHVYDDAITDGMVCAGSLDEGTDACDGDSGGPLACLNNGVFTLYGITSWGQRCGYANKPGVYVKVAHYRKWIDDNFYKHSLN